MDNAKQQRESSFRAMGTDVTVTIVAPATQAQAAVSAESEVQKIFENNEKIFSRFDPASELSKINQSIGVSLGISEPMRAVLELCLKFNKEMEGFFDPRILSHLEQIGYTQDFRKYDPNNISGVLPTIHPIEGCLSENLSVDSANKTVITRQRIDTTGIVKGYTVDMAAQHLQRLGFSNFVVDAGGDMQANGVDEQGNAWEIGIEGLEGGTTRLVLRDEGVATSGISRKRWTIGGQKVHHLINPKQPASFSHTIRTVTVIDKKTVEADGRAKSLFLMGRENGIQFANANRIKALFLDYQNNIYVSQSIKENIK